MLVTQTVTDALNTAGLSSHPASSRKRPDGSARVTPNVTFVLSVLAILTGYGRHLAQTLEKRSVGRGFATIARFFGTAVFDTILAHLHRGLRRAIALEKLLMRRAAQGRDLRMQAPRDRFRDEPADDAAAEVLTPEQEEVARVVARAMADIAAEAAAIRAGERLSRRIGRNEPLTLDTVPSMEVIEAQVARSPVGRTIGLICRDFGVSPLLCDGAFWSALFDAIRLHRGSASGLARELQRRETRFDKDDWKYPGLALPENSREGALRVLGFRIGDEPDWPGVDAMVGLGVGVVPAVATGPP